MTQLAGFAGTLVSRAYAETLLLRKERSPDGDAAFGAIAGGRCVLGVGTYLW